MCTTSKNNEDLKDEIKHIPNELSEISSKNQ
jgi:hypothetical protein